MMAVTIFALFRAPVSDAVYLAAARACPRFQIVRCPGRPDYVKP